jgi:hypothetical protein
MPINHDACVKAITDVAISAPYTIINAASANKTHASNTTPRGRSTTSFLSTIDRITVIVSSETHEFSWQPLPTSEQLLNYGRTASGRIRIAFVPRRLEDGNNQTQVVEFEIHIVFIASKQRTQTKFTQDRERKTFHRASPHAFSIGKHRPQEQLASRIRHYGS